MSENKNINEELEYFHNKLMETMGNGLPKKYLKTNDLSETKNILERLDDLTPPNYKGDLYLNEEDYNFIMSKEIDIENSPVKKTGIKNVFEYEGVYLGFVLNAMPIYKSDKEYSYIKFKDKII
jgi:hypothetical protein